MTYKLVNLPRPSSCIIQVYKKEDVVGSFSIPKEDEMLWIKVAEFIRKEQAKDVQLDTRIN